MTDNHQIIKLAEIPPELAAAIVAAQTAADKLRRDGKGDKGKYTTSDAIAAEGSRVLNEHGAAWVRTGLDFAEPGLASSDIGNQAYVGDLVQTWMIVHKGGAALVGCSRMPVITSRGRPPDKATAASLTYDVGQVLRGALCMERENENAIDRRQDVDDGSKYRQDRPKGKRASSPDAPPDIGPRCTGKAEPIAIAIDELATELSGLLKKDKWLIYRSAVKHAGIDLAPYDNVAPNPSGLLIADGKAVKAKLEAKISEVTRQPGDDGDDPTGEAAP